MKLKSIAGQGADDLVVGWTHVKKRKPDNLPNNSTSRSHSHHPSADEHERIELTETFRPRRAAAPIDSQPVNMDFESRHRLAANERSDGSEEPDADGEVDADGEEEAQSPVRRNSGHDRHGEGEEKEVDDVDDVDDVDEDRGDKRRRVVDPDDESDDD